MVDHEHVHIGRRKMILAMGWLTLLPLAGLWGIMVRREQVHQAGRISILDVRDIPEGGSYHGDFWIRKEQENIYVYSTRCSHLGCKVQPGNDGRLHCPCHGSEFDQKDGSVLAGPAGKPLEMLDYTIEDDLLTVYIQ
jgi:Rieske Fe-S protein